MNITKAFNVAKTVVTSKVGRQALVLEKHSPAIMFGAGVVGMVATVVVASRATLKLEEVFETAQDKLSTARELHEQRHMNYSDKDYYHDVTLIRVRTVGNIMKIYAPAFILGSVSIGLLGGSHYTLNKRNAGLIAAYAALEKGFDQYRGRVVEELGEEKDREFRYGVEEQKIVEQTDKGEKTRTVKRASSEHGPSVYARFFDQFSNNWSKEPEYNLVFLKCQQNWANDQLVARGHLFLNEVYDMLGIERSKAGAVVGWVLSKDGDNFVDFGIFDGDRPRVRDFVNGREGAILLDFNVDGVIYDKI